MWFVITTVSVELLTLDVTVEAIETEPSAQSPGHVTGGKGVRGRALFSAGAVCGASRASN